MNKCGACGKFLSRTEAAICTKCPSVYHRGCVGVPESGSVRAEWICPECTRFIPRDNESDTPVKGHISAVTGNDSKNFTVSTADLNRTDKCTGVELDSELSPVIKQFVREELRTIWNEIKQFRKEMQDIKNTYTSHGERLDALEQRVASLEQRLEEQQSMETQRLEDLVENLRHELNEKDQDMLCNDFDISNIPEESGENTAHLVTLVAVKLGVQLREQDIVFAERVGAKDVESGVSRNSENNKENGVPCVAKRRPRTIVVRVTRRALRDEVLKCARVRRGADTAGLGLTAATRTIYVNERLTRYNRQLFRKARDAANSSKWKYVWTKRGRVYARRQHGESVHRIMKEADLQRVFGEADIASNST